MERGKCTGCLALDAVLDAADAVFEARLGGAEALVGGGEVLEFAGQAGLELRELLEREGGDGDGLLLGGLRHRGMVGGLLSEGCSGG